MMLRIDLKRILVAFIFMATMNPILQAHWYFWLPTGVLGFALLDYWFMER
jgi:hypothetical protein